jgi:hypothetical protein
MRNLRALVGERIQAVVLARDEKRHVEHAYLILDDDSHVEIYVNQGGVSQRWASGLEEVVAAADRNGFDVTGTWRARQNNAEDPGHHQEQEVDPAAGSEQGWENVRLPFPPDVTSLTSKVHLVRANRLRDALAVWADQGFDPASRPASATDDEFKSALATTVLHGILGMSITPDRFFGEVLLPFTSAYKHVDRSGQSDLIQVVLEAANALGRGEEVARFMAGVGRSLHGGLSGEHLE